MKKNFALIIVSAMMISFTFCQTTEELCTAKIEISTDNPQEMDQRLKFVNAALAYKGAPYQYGGTTADGMDCSGLIYRSALDALNKALPHGAKDISHYAGKLSAGEKPQIGDLIFFNTVGDSVSHVGIYLGDGRFIHAASQGPEVGVVISKLSEKYWKNCFLFYGSIF